MTFQFTPPRGGRLAEDDCIVHTILISIHAPVWGATRGAKSYGQYLYQFQFTPPCGGRPPGGGRTAPRAHHFNSRPRVGGDPPNMTRGTVDVFQFTPPCGGRLQDVGFLDQLVDFNSRPRVGGDRAHCPEVLLGIQFQFTPPCGGRPWNPGTTRSPCYFNSRPRAGGDLVSESLKKIGFISIHAPVRGATPQLMRRDVYQLFQFTPPCGGRPHQRRA